MTISMTSCDSGRGDGLQMDRFTEREEIRGAGPYCYRKGMRYVFPEGKRDCPSDIRYRLLCVSGAVSGCDYAVMYLLSCYGPMTAAHVRNAMKDRRIPGELKLSDEPSGEYTKNPYAERLKRLSEMGFLEQGRFSRERGDGTVKGLFRVYSVSRKMRKRVLDSAVGHLLSSGMGLSRCGFEMTEAPVRMLEHLSALTMRISCETGKEMQTGFLPYSPDAGIFWDGILTVPGGERMNVLSVRNNPESMERLKEKLSGSSFQKSGSRLLLILETKEMYPRLRKEIGITEGENDWIYVTTDGEAYRTDDMTYWKMIEGAMCTVDFFQ